MVLLLFIFPGISYLHKALFFSAFSLSRRLYLKIFQARLFFPTFLFFLHSCSLNLKDAADRNEIGCFEWAF